MLDPESTVLAIFPSPMMYAGPTEVYTISAWAHIIHVCLDIVEVPFGKDR